jgi:hypothetical protein
MIAVLLLVLSRIAVAEEPPRVALTPEIGTEVPLAIDIGVRAELPKGLRVRLGAGYLPAGYVRLANALVTAAWPTYYDEETANLVESALRSSLLLRARVDWRPSERRGFVFGAGVSLASLGGDATTAEVMEGLTGVSARDGEAEEQQDITIDTRTVFLDVGIGWEFAPFKEASPLHPLRIRPTLGWAFSVWSRSDLEPAWAVPPEDQQRIDRLEAASEVYLDDVMTTYVHPPLFGVQVGWQIPVLK